MLRPQLPRRSTSCRARRLAELYPDVDAARTVNIDPPPGDQGPRARLRGRGARAADGIVEAIRWRGPSYRIAAVQWHPEFHRAGDCGHARRPADPATISCARRAPRTHATDTHEPTPRRSTTPPPATRSPSCPPTTPRVGRRQGRRARAPRSRPGRRGRWPSARPCIARFRAGVVARPRHARRDPDRARSASRSRSRATSSTACSAASTSSSREAERADRRRDRVRRRRHARADRRTSRWAWSPTSRPGTTRTSSAATCSCRRCSTGNAVLYKPSEYATLTGLRDRAAAARGRRAAGRVRAAGRRRRGRRGAARAAGRRRVLHRLVRHRHAHRRRRSAPRLVKLQLELGGKDPTYVCEDVDAEGRGRSRSPTARCTTPARAAARSSASTCTRRSTTPSSTPSSPTVHGFKVGDPMRRGHLHRRHHARAAAGRARGAGRRRAWPRARAAAPAASASRGPGNWFAPTVLRNVDHAHGADARRELRPDHRHPEGDGRRRGGAR